MRIKTSVKSNTKKWDMVVKRLNKASATVNVGWWHSRHPTGIPVAQVAMFNEEGHFTPRGAYSPPRPFLRIGAFRKIKKVGTRDYAHDVYLYSLGKMKWSSITKKLSDNLLSTVKQEILDWKHPANAEYTIAQKGFNDPLIDTGTMYDTLRTITVRRRK